MNYSWNVNPPDHEKVKMLYSNPPRLPRMVSQTKNDLRNLYESDENAFWTNMAIKHNSLTGCIHFLFKLSKSKIKKAFKSINDNRRAQIILSKIIIIQIVKIVLIEEL